MLNTLRMYPFWLLLLVLSFVSACAGGKANVREEGRAAPAQGEDEAVARPTVYQLPNGLTVVLREERSAPVVAMQMWVRVGGADEVESQAGIAHVFEHMLFKGTDKREVGQIGREVSAAGGDINAYTSNDQTVYHLTLASRFFDTGLDILADATQNSSFDPEELRKELEVVVEEIRRGRDNPDRALHEAMSGKMFPRHPYGRPVIGSEETVRSLTRQQILDFFKNWYAPNNMTLVIVGDFETAEAREKIAAAFRGFESNPDLSRERPGQAAQNEFRFVHEIKPFQQERLAMGFHIPPINDEESWAMDVISDMMSGSSNGLLISELVHRLRLATSVYTYSWTPVDPGYFVAGATYDPQKRPEVIRQSLRILFDLANGDVPEDRLEFAKSKVAADFVYQMETAQGMASQLGFFKVIAGDIDFDRKYLDYIAGLTPTDIAEVARKYLHPENLTLAVVSDEDAGKADEVKVASIVSDEWERARKRAPALKVVEREQIEGTTVVRFDNGTSLLVTPDPSLPIVSITGGFLGGLRNEPAEWAGITNFMTGALTLGTENLTREQLVARLEDINGSLSFRENYDNVSFSMRYIQDEETVGYPGLDIFADVVQRASFPAEEVESVRQRILPQFRLRQDNLFELGLLEFLPAMFGENGYGRMGLGDEEVVRRIQRDDLRDYKEDVLRSDSMVVSVVGNVEAERFIEEYARRFASHRAQGEFRVAELDFPAHNRPVSGVVEKGKAQSHIFYGWPGPDIRSDDRYAFEVMNAIMAGMGGRLFLQLRDRQSLAYSVTSILPLRYEAGTWLVYIATAPDKVDEAVTGVKEQIRLLRERGVSEREVEEAKSFLIGNMAVDLQTRIARASTMANGELSGLGFRFAFDEYPERIDAVSVEDVNRVAREYLLSDRVTFVLVK